MITKFFGNHHRLAAFLLLHPLFAPASPNQIFSSHDPPCSALSEWHSAPSFSVLQWVCFSRRAWKANRLTYLDESDPFYLALRFQVVTSAVGR